MSVIVFESTSVRDGDLNGQREELLLDLPQPHKKPGMAADACDLSSAKQRQENPVGSLDNQGRQSMSATFSERLCLKF